MNEANAGQSFVSYVDRYLEYFASVSSHTARAKRLDLEKFSKFLSDRVRGKKDIPAWDDFTAAAIQGFIEVSLKKGEAPTTVQRRLATLKHFGRTMAERIPGLTNPARDVRAPRVAVSAPKSLKPADVEALKEKAAERRSERDSFIRVRNEMIIHLFLDTGLRADEIRLLRLSQIDESLEWLTGVRTKGRRYRNVYLSQAIRPRLKEYLEERRKELARFFPKLSARVDAQLPVFISTYGAKTEDPESFLLGAKTLWRAVRECSAGQSLHPHLLRHTFATELLDHAKDIRLVSQALGHSDIKVTMRYTERQAEDIAQEIESLRRKQKA